MNEQSDVREYLVLIYGDESYWADVPEEKLPELYAPFEELGRRLAASPHTEITGVELQQASSATFVRGGVVGVTAGPLAELAEQLGGAYLIRTADVESLARLYAEVFASEPYLFEFRPVMDPEDSSM